MRIQQLSQKHADDLMKSLGDIYFKNWEKAFRDESDNLDRREIIVALSGDKRIYFTVESYLVGINNNNPISMALSSFARVLAARPRGNCAMCLSVLFKEKLFPMCRQKGKSNITARLEPDGEEVFKDLKAFMPPIQLVPGYYCSAIVPVPSLRI